MRLVRVILIQSAGILALSVLLALGTNALRPDGLPLVHARAGAVQLDQNIREIPLKDAAMLFLGGRAVFLDARSPLEHMQGRIRGSLSLPPAEFPSLFERIRPRLAGAEAIIAYCDGERCPLAHELAELLRAAGFKNVWVLKNGWTLWNSERLPVETPRGGGAAPARDPVCTQCGD
jgi:rhodanese-related sulfurtransferase